MNNATSITGRDDYIISQALIYAIARIQSLPDKKQEWSNMCDMCAIARAGDARGMGLLAAGVYAHTGVLVDLWPDPDEAGAPVWKADYDRTVEQLINMSTRAA